MLDNSQVFFLHKTGISVFFLNGIKEATTSVLNDSWNQIRSKLPRKTLKPLPKQLGSRNCVFYIYN